MKKKLKKIAELLFEYGLYALAFWYGYKAIKSFATAIAGLVK